MVLVVFVFVFLDVWRVVTDEYNTHARTVTVGIATAAIAAPEERMRIAEARAAAAAMMEATKWTDKADGTIDAARGGDGGGGSPILAGQSPAAPRRQHHPPYPAPAKLSLLVGSDEYSVNSPRLLSPSASSARTRLNTSDAYG